MCQFVHLLKLFLLCLSFSVLIFPRYFPSTVLASELLPVGKRMVICFVFYRALWNIFWASKYSAKEDVLHGDTTKMILNLRKDVCMFLSC